MKWKTLWAVMLAVAAGCGTKGPPPGLSPVAGFDLQAVPAVFLGGGARLFERNVSPQDRLCRLITLPDVCLNAAGFERLAGQILKR